MTLAEFLSYFAIYGPLGIWCAVAEWRSYNANRAHHKTRDECAAEVNARHESHEKRVSEIIDAHQSQLAARDQAHFEQIAELNNRYVAINEGLAGENRKLTDQVRIMIEVLNRKRGR